MNTFVISMKIPEIPLAQSVVKLCLIKGIRHIVISPGSRNAPLTIGFTNIKFFKCYSIVDERCAAFFALGIAQQSGEPVAVVCTSGSALLNYYPAVSEAFHSEIPLVVISADRPKYLIGIGDGQTIDQKEVFGTHTLYNANLQDDISRQFENSEDEPKIIKNLENKLERFIGLHKTILEKNEIEINKALNIAFNQRGPVHINVPFNEPLYNTLDEYTVDPVIIDPEKDLKDQTEQDWVELKNAWAKFDKKMILVGSLQPETFTDGVLDLLNDAQDVIVFSETTSNLYRENFFPSIDKIIAPLDEKAFEELQPDLLITVGGLVVSKKIKAFLRKYSPKQHWHLGYSRPLDTYFSLSRVLKADPNRFFKQILSSNRKLSEYRSSWLDVKLKRQEKHQEYLQNIPFSDLKVFDHILTSLPEDSVLQVGNSSAIRYTQLFDLRPDIEVYCNRGTSGIDGSTSTAIGFATISDKRTTFITGDLSFFYDSNALWNNYVPNDFRIILINNNGGGIFRILPGHKNTENFDKFFETVHELNASHLCKMYGWEYSKASDVESLKKSLTSFYRDNDKPKLLEIFTPRLDNDEILLNYFEFIK